MPAKIGYAVSFYCLTFGLCVCEGATPTGTVSISGNPELGQSLNASNDLADGDGLGTISYQWKRNGRPIKNTIEDDDNGTDGLGGANAVVVSPNGKFVFVTGSSANENAVSWFQRSSATGALTYEGTLDDGVNGVDGLSGANAVTISPDGSHVYVTGGEENALSWFEVNSSTGALTYEGTLEDEKDNVDGLFGANSVVVSPDGAHVYATASSEEAVSWFTRNSSTGVLTYGGSIEDDDAGIDGLGGANSVAVSPDGSYVYVTGESDNSVSWFSRNSSTGALTYGGTLEDEKDNVDGLFGANSVAVSPTGSTVYATGGLENAISWFEVNATTGILIYESQNQSSYLVSKEDLDSTVSVNAKYVDLAGNSESMDSSGVKVEWWREGTSSTGGWRILSWFGSFLPFDNGWTYHIAFGWGYVQTDGQGGIWFWTKDHEWLWTKPDSYPHFWKHSSTNWLYLFESSGKLYDYTTKSIL